MFDVIKNRPTLEDQTPNLGIALRPCSVPEIRTTRLFGRIFYGTWLRFEKTLGIVDM